MVSEPFRPFDRRQFLRFTTGMGAAIALDQFRPAYGQSEGGKVTEYPDEVTLHIQETPFTIGDRQGTAVTVNGSVPAPLLRFREGQTVKLNVVNHLKEDTSIHWHGIILPFDMDGVPGVSFAGIKPGATFTYRFPLNQSGTYWYHSHSGMQEQRGHYGVLIIDPLEPDPFEYDRDYSILLSDWTFENPHAIMRNLKRMPTFYNNQRRTIANLAEDWDWKGMRMDPVDIADVTGATYSYLLNGQTPDRHWTGIFTPGEKVRLRFINGSAMTFFDVRIPGLKMTVVQADGQNVEPVTVDEFRMGTAETYDVIVEPTTEEAYTIFAETMDRSGYARGTLAVKPGLSAPLPPRRDRPVRTMADMGHGDHGSHSDPGRSDNHSNHDQANTSSSHSNHNDHGTNHTTDHSAHQMTDNPEPMVMESMDHSIHSTHSAPTEHSNHTNHEGDHGMAATASTYQPQSYPHGPDDHGIGPDHGLAQVFAQHHLAAQRRARHHGVLASGEPAGVDDVEAVDVLGRVDGVDDGVFVDLFGQGQLHQDAVDAGIGVELLDLGQDLGVAGGIGHAELEAFHAGLDRLLALGADIDLAGRVLAHQDHRQPRRDAVLRLQFGDLGRHALAHLRREGLAVDQCCGHVPVPSQC